MLGSFLKFWYQLSMIGLKEHENVLEFRNVIIINRLLFVFEVVLFLYLPMEIYLNGLELLPMVLCLMGLLALPFYFQKKRWFNFSRYYIYVVGTLFISSAGLLVGKGAGNYVTLIPVAMVGIILFPQKKQKFISLLILMVVFFSQQYLFRIIEPTVYLSQVTLENFSLIFFSLAILLNFILGYHLTSVNSEFEDIILDQRNELVKKNLEITDSITYAKRIQTAILAPEKLIKTLLDEVFILYLPKDIVAGDFYWLEKKGDLIYFAVADCTGHGVPGAMVSVVCNNALKRSLFEYGLQQPADILNKSREIIVQEFMHSEEEIKDGMDISLCVFDPTSKQLSWAGAHNPLWIVRQNQLIEYKADKQPVGLHTHMKAFTNHQIQLEKGDMLYIFSDGYADQFGGENGKKLKIKELKKMLLELNTKDLHDQREHLFHNFQRWKDTNEQVDDVCILGVRI